MGSRTNGIVYEPDKLASRHRLAIAGAAVELVQVPPVPHAFQHCSSAHLLMFTETGMRSDGESRAEGHAVSTMRDTSNTFSILPAGVGYDGWTIPTVPARYLSLAVEPHSPLIGALTRDVLWRAPVVYGRQIPENIQATLVKLRASITMAENHVRLYSEALFQVLLIELAQWLGQQTARPVGRGGLTPRQQRLVCDFIRKEAASDISLTQLARLCDLSPNHFASAFKSSLGVAPHQYQVSCRIEHAKQMLENPSIPIIDIALTVGYAGPSAFAASFRRLTGTTPRDYRKSRS